MLTPDPVPGSVPCCAALCAVRLGNCYLLTPDPIRRPIRRLHPVPTAKSPVNTPKRILKLVPFG